MIFFFRDIEISESDRIHISSCAQTPPEQYCGFLVTMSALSPSKCKACSGKHVAHVCSRSTKYRQDNGEYAGKRLANKRRMNSVGHDVDNIDQKGIKRPRKACMYPRDNGRGSRRTFLKLANSSKKTPKDTVADLRSELLSRTVVYNPETKMHCREWDTTDVVKGVISALQKNGTLTSSQVASIIGAPEGHVCFHLEFQFFFYQISYLTNFKCNIFS